MPTTFIKASNNKRGVRFGERVSVYGDTVAVAATGEASPGVDADGDQADDGLTEAGAVYVLH